MLATIKPDIRSQDEDWPARAGKQAGDLVDGVRVGLISPCGRGRAIEARCPGCWLRVLGACWAASPIERLQARVQEDRAPVPGAGQRECLVGCSADLAGHMHGPGPLGDRREERRVIEFLEAA